MAIVEGPALSLRASGNLGTICYAHWRGVSIARDIWTGTQPNIGRQKTVQDIFKVVVQAWSGLLLATERAMWEDYAGVCVLVNKLGLKWTPTGYQVFVRMNVFRLQEVLGIMTVPPAVVLGVYAETVKIVAGSMPGEAWVEMTDWAGIWKPDLMQVYRCGPFDNGGYHARGCDYRWILSEPSPFSHLFSGLLPGKYYWFRLRVFFNIGVVGNWYEGQVLIP